MEGEVRIFKGLSEFKVYHFGSLTTRKNKNIKPNRGDNTFLKNGVLQQVFKKYYSRSKTKYMGPLEDPKKDIIYYFELLKSKFKLLYIRFCIICLKI